MDPFIFFIIIFVSCVSSFFSSFCSSEFIYPNFTASNFQFADQSGAFLSSRNGTFKAAIYNPPDAARVNFYLCVIHVESNIIIWSANRDDPISNSGKMSLTVNGIAISEQGGSLKWSTPPLESSVSALLLSETGNLFLLDQFNGSLWESFQYPTDTLVVGQHLPVGTSLYSAKSDNDLSTGNYNLTVGASDVVLQWYGKAYWKLSMDTSAYTNSNDIVEYMTINQTGIYLFGRNGSVVVIQVILSPSDFRVAKLNSAGQFIVSSYSGTSWKQEFVGPDDACRIPFICHRIGLCANDAASAPVCSCPPSFHADSQNTGNCVPSDASFTLPSACNLTNNGSLLNTSGISYLAIGYGIDYFAIDFSEPVWYGVNLLACQNLCSNDCSCMGIFYGISSGYCYVLENELGSFMSNTTGESDLLGYVKAIVRSSPTNTDGAERFRNKRQFPIAALVLLPFTGFSLFIALGFLWWRRGRLSRAKGVKLGHPDSPSSGELDAFSIPGLPRRLNYEELEVATDNFKTQIGSGGFGTVYKGTLPDKTLVAVKKITNLGIQGKREFCTEIAIIGNIHHVNLVKLRGFCAQGRQRLLVLEYMNRGSLDQTLFGSGPAIEWQERVDIALGTARGLAYLHSGCQQKIIHCDVKPENILLHDNFQVKISDFGLSKLLSTEQSSFFTLMRGTRGYLAPEWLTNIGISDKADVYSFGMVLLELVSGWKNWVLRTQSHSTNDEDSGGSHSSSSSGLGLIYFPLFALEMHEQKRYLELADPRLEGRVTNIDVEKLVCVALCCVHEEPSLRPNMVSVVSMLEGRIPLSQPRVESLKFLRFYGRRFIEASLIEEGNEQSDVILYPQVNVTNTTTSSSPLSFSYISSQQISGPR